MMEQYINIDKSLIPYRFAVELRAKTFEFEIRYDEDHKFFTVGLYKDEEFIAEEKLVYGKKLFLSIEDETFPKVDLIPNDPSGFQNKITYENFNETVFLEVIE